MILPEKCGPANGHDWSQRCPPIGGPITESQQFHRDRCVISETSSDALEKRMSGGRIQATCP